VRGLTLLATALPGHGHAEQVVRLWRRHHCARRPVRTSLWLSSRQAYTPRYIRLASDLPSRSGYLFSKIPLTATNWEIEFEFKIDGKGSLHADGMALWVTKQRAQQGDVFGHTNNFEGLGIFFDTYKNNRPGTVFPYVMAVVGDGNTAYNKNDDGKDQELAGCSVRIFHVG
jgi:mannose-binding lectin 2